MNNTVIENYKKCVMSPVYISAKWKTEVGFVEHYLEKNKNNIDWWFKNGNQGKEYFAVKYFNSVDGKEALFYPDFIIHFKSGKIGIFDTKKDQTATDPKTADKAEALVLRLKELSKDCISGIVVFENGVWNYNGSKNYHYQEGKISQDKNWLPMEKLF